MAVCLALLQRRHGAPSAVEHAIDRIMKLTAQAAVQAQRHGHFVCKVLDVAVLGQARRGVLLQAV